MVKQRDELMAEDAAREAEEAKALQRAPTSGEYGTESKEK
jgi:hypothetical protein